VQGAEELKAYGKPAGAAKNPACDLCRGLKGACRMRFKNKIPANHTAPRFYPEWELHSEFDVGRLELMLP
jgi:hypothetical protein